MTIFSKCIFFNCQNNVLQDEINSYGIDDNGPLPNPVWNEDALLSEAIEVPEIHLPISPGEIDHHLSQLDPLANSQNFGIDIYVQVPERLNSVFGTT